MPHSFPIISYLLLAISLVSIITLYLALKVKLPIAFKKVFVFTVCLVFFNSTYSFIIEIAFGGKAWSQKIIPFILLYGPIIYYGLIAIKKETFSKIGVALHSLPFLIYTLYFLSSYLGLVGYSMQVVKSLYVVAAMSFISYSLLSFIIGRNLLQYKLKDKLLVFVFGRILLLFIAMLFIIVIFSSRISNNWGAVNLLRVLIYFCLLLYIGILFNFVVKRLVGNVVSLPISDTKDTNKDIDLNKNSRYEKSSLTDEQLIFYQKKLTKAMLDEKLYLNPTLSLTSLSTYLKLPNHHLTQVFSVQINQTFYQYINSLRIAYACQLLKSEEANMNFEELAEQSGFNSKPSFNRQFKLIMNCTPSEYRISVQKK